MWVEQDRLKVAAGLASTAVTAVRFLKPGLGTIQPGRPGSFSTLLPAMIRSGRLC